jgi:Pregnancy-associated plasma protein-A
MGKHMLWLLLISLCASGCHNRLPVFAVRLENDQYRFERHCQEVEKEIKGNTVTVNVCTVTRIPTNTPDSNPITPAQIHAVVDAANVVWSKYGYRFSFDENTDYITWHSTKLNRTPSNDAEWNEYGPLGDALSLLSNPPQDKVVVLFRGEEGMGWSSGPPGGTNVSMPGIKNLFLQHEMGHYFGLAHTFYFDSCAKLTLANTDNDVNGILPVPDDDIHDTPSDPTQKCLPPSSTNFCSNTTVTINGIVFTPPLQNVMSYYGCTPQEFSPDQIKAIKYNMKNGRSKIPILQFGF